MSTLGTTSSPHTEVRGDEGQDLKWQTLLCHFHKLSKTLSDDSKTELGGQCEMHTSREKQKKMAPRKKQTIFRGERHLLTPLFCS